MRDKKWRFPLAMIGLIILTGLYGCKQEKNKSGIQSDTDGETEKRIQLVRDDAHNKVSVLIEGKLFTAYLYPDNIKKPVLYPLIRPDGSNITRKFPLEPSVGERVDHPHQVGGSFNSGDVNGLALWNISDSLKPEISAHSGTIVHKKILDTEDGDEQASLEVAMDWIAPNGEVLLQENTTFIFQGRDDEYSIDRITKLTAPNKKVIFKDNKEGMLG